MMRDSDISSTIGQMCAEYGVTARALRFYEDEDLLAPERRGTQRLYSPRDRARLAWILRGRRVGLSLADIKELLDLYDLGDNRRTQRLATMARCGAQVDKLKQQRVDIDATIDELETFIAMVTRLIDADDSSPRKRAQGA
ncbi:MAG: MerR family DNA-binding transcriptional regulator [Sphingomicrobium sp.]